MSVATWSLRERAGVQPAAGLARELCHPPLDRHVHILVALGKRKRPAPDLIGDNRERAVQGVAVLSADDPTGRQHRGVRHRLLHIEGRQAPVERQRVVQTPEGVRLGLRHARARHQAVLGIHQARDANAPGVRRAASSTAASVSATRPTSPSLISGKNGIAIDREAMSSHTGN